MGKFNFHEFFLRQNSQTSLADLFIWSFSEYSAGIDQPTYNVNNIQIDDHN